MIKTAEFYREVIAKLEAELLSEHQFGAPFLPLRRRRFLTVTAARYKRELAALEG